VNWKGWRRVPWIDTRAAFVAAVRRDGALLDLGTSDGSTLAHFAELRPDLRLHAVDIAPRPAGAPSEVEFVVADLERDTLPWPASTFDAITCMHVVEHLHDLGNFWKEVSRLLRPGGRIYIETPSPKSLVASSATGKMAGQTTQNFWDDPSHVRPVTIGAMAQAARSVNLRVETAGTSRNWLFALAYWPLRLVPVSRKRLVARLHWTGWSAYLIASKI